MIRFIDLGKDNWSNVIGKNGENILHQYAKYEPSVFVKYAITKDGLKLLNVQDNDGRYPMEHFLCFASFDILRKDIKELAASCEVFRIKKPNWLEVNMLAKI